jgi:hypothetical protein
MIVQKIERFVEGVLLAHSKIGLELALIGYRRMLVLM